jgi:ribosomal protein S24E
MNISIDKRTENALFNREDINFKMEFDSAVPSREQAKSALSTAISIPKERIVIVSINSKYGSKVANASAHIYKKDAEALKDKSHLLVRDKLVSKKDKSKETKAPAPKK